MKAFVAAVFLLSAGLLTIHAIPSSLTLEDVCKVLEKLKTEGKIEMLKKSVDDCAGKTFAKEKIDAVAKCRDKFDFEDPEFVTKACTTPLEFADKFEELKICVGENRPEPALELKFHECVTSRLASGN